MKKAVIIICLISILIVSAFAGYYFASRDLKTAAFLLGNQNIILNVFDDYNDEGVILKTNNNVIDNNNYKINIDNKLNTNIIGNYSINYSIDYHNKTFNLTRNISVIDKESPVITLSTSEVTMDYCLKKITPEIKYSALDNYDGDITDKINITDEDSKILYKVSDSSGNEDEKVVNIKYQSKPKDKYYLNGSQKMYVLLNSEFNDPGASYTDGCGKKYNKEITVTGDVDTKELGTYFITYSLEGYKDLTREIVVYEKTNKPKSIYLTFDDGPGAQTQKILDTLNKYNVKATFFVTHQFAGYMDLIGEEYRSGHTIAVHTYTHNYATVYTTVDGYVNDFNKMNEVIKQYTGSYSNIFRFPGGSSNTVSRNYTKGIVTQIANEMTNLGYYYFDWNVDSHDAAGANQQRVYNEVVNGVEKCSDCVVLMHDIKATTANALDDILNTLMSKGYTFKTLTSSSPMIRHRINN